MPLDTKERNDIILGAVSMTGPIAEGQTRSEWDSQLKENAKSLALMLNDNSDVARTINMLSECKNFVGTILGVQKEASSTRGFVAIKTTESKFAPDGIETVRTERTDSSAEVKAFASRLRTELTGHRVLMWVEMQEIKNSAGQKVRILQHVQDLGPDPDFDPEEGKRITIEKMTKK
ncbi:hypothetical protein Achl_4398 (plasmid) [Pseudarthrobacter chlorophenolicus A6]|uniref:Uncharacterized protein n=1 Tax=Pseudarthrobacter chlorophenolicus (strain ATCC 700700 / DSM 12829 / CIP 107037 / JCM 12360 / KCTC 9906 / NCIMB 13794 / A6) TaxID=452863 RepID=B8HIV2_PSECP|nr:hypothetical protein [Pseudarthrobacter chlorophenolicus]ACL42349.1 hypothetical protein Achl_4398 [Pseudarthrobacter chlorophenolicus A6]SDQ16860.1 hypothetical protein SAMN04489738_0455 [Pseudarthrobacter chlorophenolicus]